jgi:hypothetical protein
MSPKSILVSLSSGIAILVLSVLVWRIVKPGESDESIQQERANNEKQITQLNVNDEWNSEFIELYKINIQYPKSYNDFRLVDRKSNLTYDENTKIIELIYMDFKSSLEIPIIIVLTIPNYIDKSILIDRIQSDQNRCKYVSPWLTCYEYRIDDRRIFRYDQLISDNCKVEFSILISNYPSTQEQQIREYLKGEFRGAEQGKIQLYEKILEATTTF